MMKAVQLISHGAPGELRYQEVPDPVAGPGDVLVQVRACGLNRLDLWLEEGSLPIPISLPRIPGGEIAGQIVALGPGASNWKIGDRVTVQSNLFCGRCEFCDRGEESLCLNGQLIGAQRDGGFAERIAVPERVLVGLPDTLDFEASAALTLAASTAMHMLTNRVMVRQGDWVLVIGGASGVGSGAIQIAKQLGACVISTGSTDAKRHLATELGADYVVDPGADDWPAQVRKITSKRGVDVVVEHVGGELLGKCFECLGRGGAIVTCGATGGRDVQLKLWSIFVKEQKLIGSYGRNRKDIIATLDWAAQGRIKAVIHGVYPLAQAAEAFHALRQREVLGKVIVKMT
jgi:2-desacetyl-2-hydroxyethyl bacteriochlorophyllide A dehydrogenase